MSQNRLYRFKSVFLLLSTFLLFTPSVFGQDIVRIGVEEARAKVNSGKALLICAYSDYQCERVRLKDAMLKGELEKRLPMLSKNMELIFYCA